MRALLRSLPPVAALVLLLQVVFLGLLVLGAAVPDRPIVQHLASDVRHGAYGPGGASDGMGGRATGYTDCVAAGTGLGAPGVSAFERAVRMPRLEGCAGGDREILRLAHGERLESLQPYFRYWAGYTVLTRPVLARAGMDGVRLVAGGLFGLSLVAMVLAVARVTSRAYAVALVAPLLLSSNVLSVPSTGFSHAISLAVTFAGVALVAWATQRSERTLLMSVAGSACVFDFVDLLTTPAIPWALTAAVVAAATYRRTADLRATVRHVVAAGVVWPAAFAATWVCRWLIAAAFLGRHEVTSVVFGIARFRIDGQYASVDQTFGAAVPRNLRTWLALPVMPEVVLLLSTLVAVSALLVAWRRYGGTGILAAGALAVPALVLPGWLVLLNNHSQIHHFFVYRTVPTAVGVVVAACVCAAQAHPRAARGRSEGQGMLAYLVTMTSRTRSSSKGSPSQSNSPRNVPGSST